jgi:hypothetical protein
MLQLSHHDFKLKSKLCCNQQLVTQSVTVSSPIWGQRPDFYSCQTTVGLLMWGTLSDKKSGLFTIAAGPYQHSHYDHSLLSQVRDSPNMEGQVPVFISPGNRVAQLYPQALGSLFIASYNSQGYSGGIQTRIHTDNFSQSRSQGSFTTGSLPPISSSWRQTS